MLNTLRKQVLVAGVTLVVLLAGTFPVAAQSSHYNLQMVNAAGFSFYHVYVTSIHSTNWGYDRLGSDVLNNGDMLTLPPMAAGRYDFKLVDWQGSTCEVRNVAIYGDRYFYFTPEWLRDYCKLTVM